MWWSEHLRMFCVFSYAAVVEVLRSDQFTVVFPFRVSRQAFGETLLDIDGEAHRRQRQAMLPLLQARRVDSLLGGLVAKHADRALARFNGRGPHEFMTLFASDVPVRTICETIGIPDADVARIFELVAYLTHHLDGSAGRAEQVTVYRRELHAYLNAMPQLGGPLARAAVDAMADRVSDDELLRMVVLLLAAGMETSICSLGNTLVCLLGQPALWDAAHADPSLIAAIVRESLRFEPPQHDTVRFARTDVEIAGVRIRRGQAVKLMLASANRDDAVFADPDRFDPLRTDHARTLSFSSGGHACIGKAFATRQLELALARLVATFASVTPAGGTQPRIRGYTFRRPAELMIEVTRR